MARRKKSKKLEPIKIKKFGGVFCHRLPENDLLEELRKGDYIVYWENGWRVGKVKKNHKGYKHRWIRICAKKWNEHTLVRSKKVKPDKIKEGWREIKNEQEN
jgi:hypothetical protein